MRKKILIACLLNVLIFTSVFAHDLFLKLDTFFVKVNEKVTINVMNGSFQASEGAVSFARLQNASVVGPTGKVLLAAETDFTKNETTAFWGFTADQPGNYVAGLSTMTREIDLEGKDFNEYLEHDGIPDTLAERKTKNELDRKVRERYSKHVKAIFLAGGKQTENYKVVFGYPVELIPQSNPYKAKSGDTIEIQCLKNGKPLVNQYVMSGRELNGKIIIESNVRSDKKGTAKIKLNGPGKWYVRFINMTRLDDPKLNYESSWATLTFELR
ncbi:MAG: DUF4198 domain-containing protein [Blastocatellia bacterium]|nr:DUF4198 domain-containing protein [Blastocatellia bacterium]